MNNEFLKYTRLEHGISSMTMHRYQSALDAYINPTILEERRLNVASMDVFSRLMMDRIIFLGVPIDDDVANIVTAQLLFLASNDSSSDISLYLNTPGGHVSSGLAIYDTMQLIEPDVATICTGMAASMVSVLLCAGAAGKRSADELTEDLLSSYLDSAGVPDPELVIRPSGELRTSNFLPWQTAYSEFVFMNVLWPDFSPADLDKAIEEYNRRNRRFGGV